MNLQRCRNVDVQAVTLRRMKNDMFQGRPLIVLPPKTVAVEQLRFSEQEDVIYAAFEEKSRLDFKEYLRVGFGANYSHILVWPRPHRHCNSPPLRKASFCGWNNRWNCA